MQWIIQNITSLISIIIASISAGFTFWLNRIVISPTFKWYKSKNDDSYKLEITLTNLSARATVITSLVLKSGKQIVQDNGYDYDAMEEKLAEEKEKRLAAEKESENVSQRSQAITVADFLNGTTHDLTNARLDIPTIKPLVINKYRDSAETSSYNLVSPTPVFGNSNYVFSYWLSRADLPNKMTITSSKFISGLRKSKSFDIPRIPNEINDNNNIENQDN